MKVLPSPLLGIANTRHSECWRELADEILDRSSSSRRNAVLTLLPMMSIQANRIPMEYSEQGFSLGEIAFLCLLGVLSVVLLSRVIRGLWRKGGGGE